MARKPEQRDDNHHALGATSGVTNPVKRLRVRIVISADDLRMVRFHEDAIARLAVAAEALKSVGNTRRAEEVARIRDEVERDYATFLTNAVEPATVVALTTGRDA